MILDKHLLAEVPSWLELATTEGVAVLVDKAKDWTSFDVVAKLRGITRIKKIGHAGTLDPLATGLLIVCLGKATKSINEFQDMPKEYRAVIKLGATTKTDDAEGEEENIRTTEHCTAAMIESALASFVGDISQIPPMFSAIKKNGVPLYKLARKGGLIEREPRKVTIYSIHNLDIALPFITCDIACSKGTYIRSLARDVGEKLGTGAYLAGLRRTAIGAYRAENALTIDEISDAVRIAKSVILSEKESEITN